MAEYMDYNDVESDSFRTKKQKLRSRIAVSISALFLIAVTVFVLVRSPENVRTRFDAVTFESHKTSETADLSQNEFYRLNAAFDDEITFAPDDSFKKDFPSVWRLISTGNSALSKQQVQSFDANGAFVLALPYISETDQNAAQITTGKSGSIIGADIVVLPYTADGSISLLAPIRFSLRYYNRQNDVPTVAGVYVPLDRFRLNFYSLTVNLSGKSNVDELTAELTLNAALTKQEALNDVFAAKLGFVGIDRADRTALSGGRFGDFAMKYNYSIPKAENSLSLRISFDDLMYKKFEKITISCPAAEKFSLTVN